MPGPRKAESPALAMSGAVLAVTGPALAESGPQPELSDIPKTSLWKRECPHTLTTWRGSNDWKRRKSCRTCGEVLSVETVVVPVVSSSESDSSCSPTPPSKTAEWKDPFDEVSAAFMKKLEARRRREEVKKLEARRRREEEGEACEGEEGEACEGRAESETPVSDSPSRSPSPSR